jgi:hypothetical protein
MTARKHHPSRIGLRVAIVLIVLVAMGTVTTAASAATVSGTIKYAKGYRVLLVQANGTAKKVRITQSTGAFVLTGVALNKASLQLVRPDGSYYGPIVLKAGTTTAYTFIKGSLNLKIGSATLKGGYALVARMPLGRYQTLSAFTATAVRGKPIGASKLGRVKTATVAGYNGAGGDLDRDGVIGAFDIDDNGNLILDNVDRTHRGAARPRAAIAVAPRPSSALAIMGDVTPPPPPPPPPSSANEFRVFSNFKLCDATSINVNIPGISNVDALIARWVPPTVTLATQVIGGSTAKLDGLGNSYILTHTVGAVTYPMVNFRPATHSGSLLDLVTGPTGDAQIMPGALPSEIAAGDSFVETASDGVSYPGTLNFVFNTAPALQSYQFDTEQTPTVLTYDSEGMTALGMTPTSRLQVPQGANTVTLTFWRPQRRATPGEVGADGWIDIGRLQYRVDIPNGAWVDGHELSGTHRATGAYSNASANGIPITTTPTDDGVIDPAADAAASSAHTVSFTVSLATCFSDWASFGPGTQFDFDIQAQSAFGDNAARKLYFVLD